jgi:hypothetical protein
MDSVRSHFSFAWTKHRYKNLCKAVLEGDGRICGALEREVDVNFSELVLFPSVRSETTVVEYLYSGCL